ncbi:hypothetical protein SAMN05216466_106128 [Paraburkholderia phenazinium]|uniref:Uncharacterized protein n=1 Tax=Paraburkholderia phenazinium TaxID=60549 RepID=A0A1G7YDU7_9BURK|nr:hypothetical protein [Paraburkholderia phenazinium]SDG94100.1 hypothetical protein SAMN05216466_106128 [Paraburkholderia phenazinium]
MEWNETTRSSRSAIIYRCLIVAPDRVLMEIDVSILDELVRAGLGKDHLSVVSNSLQFSRFLERFKDKNGYVFVQQKPHDMVAIHAFDVDPPVLGACQPFGVP